MKGECVYVETNKEGGKGGDLDGVGASDCQHNAAGFVVLNQYVAGLKHACKALLHEDISLVDTQPAKNCSLHTGLPLPQRLAVLHEVSHLLEVLLQGDRAFKDACSGMTQISDPTVRIPLALYIKRL